MHPKGRGNGYVVTYGGKRFYFSGDTEGTPEMKALRETWRPSASPFRAVCILSKQE
jgi:L-ascorbate metabolism protein UlaG (beta-lactamase superfamily)